MINLIYTIFAVLCLCTGFYFGWKLADKKELPELNPIKVAEKVQTDIQTAKKKKEQTETFNKLNDIMQNINNFDGTGLNQKPIKK